MKDDAVDRIVAEITSYLQADSRDVRSKINLEIANKGAAVARDWQKHSPKTPAEIEKFYRETDSYIYELMVNDAEQERNLLRNTISSELKQRNVDTVIDFGGGVGSDAVWLAQKGFKVIYCDLPGKTFNFASWRFKKYALPIETINSPGELKNQCDSVISVEVMEHVNHPVRILMAIAGALKKGGFFLMTESFVAVGKKHPSHLRKNAYFGRFFFEMTTTALGFTCVYRKSVDGTITPTGHLYVFQKKEKRGNFWFAMAVLFLEKIVRYIRRKCRRQTCRIACF